jgi:uncharacterized SAM-binding protein YcdF (DUF218 family)
MFFTLSKIIDFILLPISWIIVLALIILLTKKATIRKKSIIILISILLIGTNPWIVNRLFSGYEMPQSKIQSHHKLAIILGGGMIRSKQEDPNRINISESADRFIQPLLLYKQGKIAYILITGGNTSIGQLRKDDTNETEQVKQLLITLGIPGQQIITENQAKNTHENAVNCKKIVDSLQIKEPVLLITSAFHMRRATACFRKESINVIPYVVDNKKKDTNLGILDSLIPSERELYKLSYLIREVAGLGIYKIMGYI